MDPKEKYPPPTCPACGTAVVVSSAEFGDTACGECGEFLFFVKTGGEARFWRYPQASRVRARLVKFIATQLGIDEKSVSGRMSFIRDSGADSLDLVELVMELEELGDE